MPHDEIRQIIAHTLGLIHTEVADDKTFAQLGADSIDGVTVAMALEEAFKVEIGDDIILTTTTVGEAIAAVEALLPGPMVAV